MLSSQNLFRVSLLAVGITGALVSGHAHAAAFQLKENSAKAQGRAFAGSASAPGDTAVVVNNPAAMRLLEGRQLEFGVSAISFGADFKGSGRYVGPTGAGTGTAISGGDGGDAGTIAAVPAIYFTTPISDNMHLGASLTVPYGFKTEYDRDWVGRYQGIKTELQAIDAGLSFSYDVNPWVSFGASVFAERLDVDLSNAIDFGTALYAQRVPGFAPGSADGYSRIKGDSTEVGFTLGGLFSIDENTHIGLTYRSQVDHKIDNGKAYFDVPGQAAAVLAVAAPGQYVDTDGKAKIILPATATASFTHIVNDQWTVMADVTRTAWSKFDKVTVDFASAQPDTTLAFNYRDTTFVSIGADYKVSDALTFRGGLAYDQTPTQSEYRDVRVPDTTRKWLSLGLTWTPSASSEWNVGYTHLFTTDPTVNETSVTASTLAGSFDVTGDILAGSYTYKF
ncbi:long-chain fatty acid transport protein [Pseudoxanthomonas sp. GM95]|uniref:outer membrane protein transport protein n=1 Tax=Pseudoxanthomonas sp. GM95 TaxID=1881043 RepID=UPI0008C05529|nr:outer membrane protein transport protein [Pseudoxanthomonas sp. GM95]SEM13474.1 long-chain fatty acid transport protein [Pseudoxanthomonas sp. GM95]